MKESQVLPRGSPRSHCCLCCVHTRPCARLVLGSRRCGCRNRSGVAAAWDWAASVRGLSQGLSPRSGPTLWCEVCRTGALWLGRGPLCLPPLWLSTGKVSSAAPPTTQRECQQSQGLIITQCSPRKQNRRICVQRKTYFKKLAHMIVGVDESEILRGGQADGDPGTSWYCSSSL